MDIKFLQASSLCEVCKVILIPFKVIIKACAEVEEQNTGEKKQYPHDGRIELSCSAGYAVARDVNDRLNFDLFRLIGR